MEILTFQSTVYIIIIHYFKCVTSYVLYSKRSWTTVLKSITTGGVDIKDYISCFSNNNI